MLRIGVVNGPNLNVLGQREPEHYGRVTLGEIEAKLRVQSVEAGVELIFFQSNHEGELVDWVQQQTGSVEGWLVNAGALTHGSIALRDALLASERPFVEVHLSNIFAREAFRRQSVLADVALAVIAGFREESYSLGLHGLIAHLQAG